MMTSASIHVEPDDQIKITKFKDSEDKIYYSINLENSFIFIYPEELDRLKEVLNADMQLEPTL